VTKRIILKKKNTLTVQFNCRKRNKKKKKKKKKRTWTCAAHDGLGKRKVKIESGPVRPAGRFGICKEEVWRMASADPSLVPDGNTRGTNRAEKKSWKRRVGVRFPSMAS
jgi:hypothetical protein